MNEILTPEKRRRAIEKEYAKIFAEQSNRIITNKVYEQLLEQRKEVDRVLKKVKEDIGQEEYAQHYKNLLNKYGQKDKFPKKDLKWLYNYIDKKVKGKKNKTVLLEDFKEAFKLATTIRQITTKEKIIFSVVQKKGNKEIGVVELNTDQMLERIKLSKVSFKKVNDNILSAIKTKQTQISQGSVLRRKSYSTQSNLYKSIATFFETTTRFSGKELNQGTRWQMYYYFYHKYNKDDSVTITDTEQLLRGYFMAKAGYAWYKGGDVGRVQVKYGNASFTSFNSVVTLLEDFKKVIDRCEKEKLKGPARTEALMSLFTVDKAKQVDDTARRTAEFAEEFSVEELDKQFKKALNKNGIKYK